MYKKDNIETNTYKRYTGEEMKGKKNVMYLQQG